MANDDAQGPGCDQMPSDAPRMHRVCFQLQVKPERIAEYRRRHAAVWPQMLRALARAGFLTLTEVFNLDDQLAALDAAPTGRSTL